MGSGLGGLYDASLDRSSRCTDLVFDRRVAFGCARAGVLDLAIDAASRNLRLGVLDFFAPTALGRQPIGAGSGALQVDDLAVDDDGRFWAGADAERPVLVLFLKRVLDNDADADLMWSVPGQLSLVRWDMQNGVKVNGSAIGGFSGYSIVDSADYNKDGTDDLLWEPDGGGSSSIIWLMLNGAKNGAGIPVGTLPNYTIATSGDYDGDGDSDLLWTNSSGQGIIWEIENGAKVTGNVVGTRNASSDVRP